MLLFFDGYESYGQTNAVAVVGFATRYNIVNGPNNVRVADGRVSGKSVNLTISTSYFQTPSLTTDATMIVGLAANFVSYGGLRLLSLYDGVTEGVNLRLKADGEFEVYRSGTLLGTTVGAAIGTSTWAYIEFKVLTHNSAGSFELRINGASVLSGSGIDTQQGANAYHNAVRFLPVNNSSTLFDDLYIADGSGSTNNDFFGSQRVIAIRPTAEGTNIDWTPSAGSDNSAMVDEDTVDGDTTYNETAGASDTDLFAYGDISAMTDIKGIQISTDCRETDGTPFSLHSVVESGGTQDDGPAEPIGSTTYVTKTRIVEQDPATAAQWTIGGINAAQFGVKIE